MVEASDWCEVTNGKEKKKLLRSPGYHTEKRLCASWWACFYIFFFILFSFLHEVGNCIIFLGPHVASDGCIFAMKTTLALNSWSSWLHLKIWPCLTSGSSENGQSADDRNPGHSKVATRCSLSLNKLKVANHTLNCTSHDSLTWLCPSHCRKRTLLSFFY